MSTKEEERTSTDFWTWGDGSTSRIIRDDFSGGYTVLCVRCSNRLSYHQIKAHLDECPKKTYACALCGHTPKDHWLGEQYREGFIGGRSPEPPTVPLCHGVRTYEERGGREHSCVDRWVKGERPPAKSAGGSL